MGLKDILEKTGIKAKENRFLKAPGHPYIVFYDDQVHRGSDNHKSIIIEHDTTIELYSKEINQDKSIDKIEKLILDELKTDFKRTREWIEEESHWLTTYDFKFTKKKGDKLCINQRE